MEQPVGVGNSHAIAFTDHDVLRRLDLSRAPVWEPADVFPTGVNIELVREIVLRELPIRVYECGYRKTLNCGTEVIASVAAYCDHSGLDGPTRMRIRGENLAIIFEGDKV